MRVRHPEEIRPQRFDEATNLWLLHVCERDLQLVIGADHVVVVKVSTQGSRFFSTSGREASAHLMRPRAMNRSYKISRAAIFAHRAPSVMLICVTRPHTTLVTRPHTTLGHDYTKVLNYEKRVRERDTSQS